MSKSACQTPCQLASCFFIFLTRSFFSSFPFLFFLFFCTSQNLSVWRLVQCVHANYLCIKLGWREESDFWSSLLFTFFFFLLLAWIKTLFITYKMIFATPKFVEAMCARGLSQIVANIGNLNETNYSNPCKLVLDHTTM